MNTKALREERITREGVYSALRSAGHAALEEVEAVVLETDGSISVVEFSADKVKPTALDGLRDFPAND